MESSMLWCACTSAQQAVIELQFCQPTIFIRALLPTECEAKPELPIQQKQTSKVEYSVGYWTEQLEQNRRYRLNRLYTFLFIRYTENVITTYTHAPARTKTTKENEKNMPAIYLTLMPPHVTYLTSSIFARFDHSSLGNLKPKLDWQFLQYPY